MRLPSAAITDTPQAESMTVCDHAPVQHTSGGITRQPRPIRHAQHRPGMFEMHDLDTQKLVVR